MVERTKTFQANIAITFANQVMIELSEYLAGADYNGAWKIDKADDSERKSSYDQERRSDPLEDKWTNASNSSIIVAKNGAFPIPEAKLSGK